MWTLVLPMRQTYQNLLARATRGRARAAHPTILSRASNAAHRWGLRHGSSGLRWGPRSRPRTPHGLAIQSPQRCSRAGISDR